MDIANARRAGNCSREIKKEKLFVFPDGVSLTRGMKASSPLWSPPRISTSSIRSDIRRTTILVPLHSPLLGPRLRIRIRGHPTFNVSSPGGRPDASSERRYSTGIASFTVGSSAPASLIILSALMNVRSLPAILPNTVSLSPETSVFVLQELYVPENNLEGEWVHRFQGI